MAITDLIPIPENTNPGLHAAKQMTMLSLLGNPRGHYNDDCQPVTNPGLRGLIVTADVGPFRVAGLEPAVRSLAKVLAEIREKEREVHDSLGSSGMLCARLVRGSQTSISNHSWGTAIDLNLNGDLDHRGDRKVQVGLARIAPIFNSHGWYWGAGFPTEDAMHFELSDEKIRELHASGIFAGAPSSLPDMVLTIGDRGPEVKNLQEALNARGESIEPDGIFGTGTRAAVIAFQARNGLVPDGVVGRLTRAALGI
jgi:putative peptidoglycan binding protein/D-alanyl-D-alanine carboxypeptidase-like protein